ncbi:MAG: hypothetical protein E7360_06945 [Clostridiales bacterium]|nr:hypothetical protein [Clostridiales bacterium]
MKKLLVFLLSFVLCFTVAFSLLACEKVEGGGQKESTGTSESFESQESDSQSTESGESGGGSVNSKTYTVSFIVEEDGYVAPTSISVKKGEQITLPTLPEGKKTFKCWVIKDTDTVFTSGVYELESNVTLVAVFYAETGIY